MTPFGNEAPLYETPVHGVFVTRDGAIRSTINRPAGVRTFEALTAELIASPSHPLILKASGTPITVLSSGGTDPDLAEYLGVSKDIADTLKLAASAVSTVSWVGAAVVFVIEALEWLGLFGEAPNPFGELEARLMAQLKTNLRATLAGTTITTMQNIAAMVAHAETAGTTVGEYLRRPTPAREALLPSADYWSRYAMKALSQEAYWMRTYDVEASPVPPGGTVNWEFGPIVQGGLQWDWRLTLPAYLKALVARLAVIRVLDPSGVGTYRQELLGYANHLRMLEQRIRGGMVRSRLSPDVGFAYWMISIRDPCGVVEMQSGIADAEWNWTPAYWFKDPIDTEIKRRNELPMTYAGYQAWHDEAASQRYWRLYEALGLFSFWTMIPDVEEAAKIRFERFDEPPKFSELMLKGISKMHARTRIQLGAFKTAAQEREAHRVTSDPPSEPVTAD